MFKEKEVYLLADRFQSRLKYRLFNRWFSDYTGKIQINLPNLKCMTTFMKNLLEMIQFTGSRVTTSMPTFGAN
jgi:hypothetical protein